MRQDGTAGRALLILSRRIGNRVELPAGVCDTSAVLSGRKFFSWRFLAFWQWIEQPNRIYDFGAGGVALLRYLVGDFGERDHEQLAVHLAERIQSGCMVAVRAHGRILQPLEESGKCEPHGRFHGQGVALSPWPGR
jgi:hypothetical protein